jgi:hypothetical protein
LLLSVEAIDCRLALNASGFMLEQLANKAIKANAGKILFIILVFFQNIY